MRGSLVVGAGILVGNVTGFFRVIAIAYLLGTHARADALAVAIGPIDVLNAAIINTMLVSFVPMLVLRDPADRAAFFARAARVFAAILLFISAAVALFAPQLISLLGPGLAPAQHDQAVLLMRLIAPATFFGGTSAVFAALLYTDRRFLAPALYQATLNGATIVAAITLWQVFGVNAFAIGYTCGAALQLAVTYLMSRDLRRIDHRTPRLPDPTMREILARPAMFLLYAGLLAANILVTRAFATHAGPGMAAAFDYCLRCVSVVVAYLVYPVANSLLPEIARLRGINNTPHAYRLVNRSLAMMAIASVVACAVGIALRTPVIYLLFERGNFTADSTRLVSAVFLGFAPAIVGWTLMDLISRCFFALDRPKMPLIAAFIPVIVNVVVMSAMRGRLMNADPALLGLGASAGLMLGFGALFSATHLRRGAAVAMREAVGVG